MGVALRSLKRPLTKETIMNKQQIRNGSVFSVEDEKVTTTKEKVIPSDNGLVLEELYIGFALLGLMINGETIGVGRRAVAAANEVIDAMHEDRYGDNGDRNA
jgi:hypothetical protein